MALTDNLISYWPLNSGGNAIDLVGSNTLTSTNSVGTGVGLTYPLSRDFAVGSTQYLTIADNASVSITGDASFEFTTWVNFRGFGGGFPMIITKDDVGGNREYALYYNQGSTVFSWETFDGGFGANQATFGLAASTGVWYFINCGRDAATNTSYLSVNNGISGIVTNTTVFDGAAPFQIGARNGGNTFDGQIGATSFHKRILTPAERTSIYNGGVGLRFEDYAYSVPDSYFSRSYFAKNFFAGNYWPTPGEQVYDAPAATGGGGSSFNKDYSFGLISTLLNNTNALINDTYSNNFSNRNDLLVQLNRSFNTNINSDKNIIANINSNLPINFGLVTNKLASIDTILGIRYTLNNNDNVLTSAGFNIAYVNLINNIALINDTFANSITQINNANTTLNKALPINLLGSETLVGQINTNLGLVISLLKNNNALSSKDLSLLINTVNNLNAQLTDGFGLGNIGGSNLNSLINTNYPIGIGLLYDLIAAAITLKDFNFAINLSLTTNLLSIKNSNFLLNVGLNKTNIGLLGTNLNTVLGYGNNLLGLANKNLILSAGFTPNNAGQLNRNLSIITNPTSIIHVSLDRNFRVNTDLLKNLLVSKNPDFGLRLDAYLNNNSLSRADLPIRIAIDRDTAQTLLKTYAFPLVVDLNYDLLDVPNPVIILVEGIDDNFWCIIKEINSSMSTKDIVTNISQPTNIQTNVSSRETTTWAISHEIIKITKGK